MNVDFGDGPYLCSAQAPVCAEGKICSSGQCVDPGSDIDAGVFVDGGIDAASTLVIPTFGSPTVLTELASIATDDDPTVTADLTTLVFNSDRSGALEFWASTRASTDEPWGPPALLDEFSAVGVHSTTAISPDGLTFMFSSTRDGGLGETDLYVSSRGSVSDQWSEPINVAALNSVERDQAAYISNNANTVYFDSNRSGVVSIYKAERLTGTDYEAPTLVTELNGDANSVSASARLAANGLVVVFHRRQDSDLDLFAATRSSIDLPFSAPQLITELSTVGVSEEDPWISDDLCTLVFATLDSDGIRNLHVARCL